MGGRVTATATATAMDDVKAKCTIVLQDVILTAAIIILFSAVSVDRFALDPYFSFGPGESLSVAGVGIRTPLAYVSALATIVLYTWTGSRTSSRVAPFLFKEIVSTRPNAQGEHSLRFMFISNSITRNIRFIFSTLIVISQVDFALLVLLVRTWTEIGSYDFILGRKTKNRYVVVGENDGL